MNAVNYLFNSNEYSAWFLLNKNYINKCKQLCLIYYNNGFKKKKNCMKLSMKSR